MSSRTILALILVSLAVLIGCAPPEALEVEITPESRDAPRPEIAPLEPLLQAPDPRLTPDDADQLMNRARAAQARANALR